MPPLDLAPSPPEVVPELNHVILGATPNPELKRLLKLKSSSGLNIIAASTSKPGATKNQDRAVAIEYPNGVVRVGVIDGLGSHTRSDLAAQEFAESLCEAAPVNKVLEKFQLDTREKGDAVFAVADIRRNKNGTFSLRTSHIGDCKVIVFDSSGQSKFSTIDQNLAVQELIGSDTPMRKKFDPQNFQGFDTPEIENRLINSPNRHIVLGTIGNEQTPLWVSDLSLNPDDVVLVLSDAFTDNFTIHEISDIIKDQPDLESKIRALNTALFARMKEREPNIAYIRQKSKNDDASITGVEIPKSVIPLLAVTAQQESTAANANQVLAA